MEEMRKERLYQPDISEFQYMGRIDFSNRKAPILVYPYSMIRFRYMGSFLKIRLHNRCSYWENYLGLVVDDVQTKIHITEQQKEFDLTLADHLADGIHDITIFKRMDACHEFTFLGVIGDEHSKLDQAEEWPKRRIEIYGDSVSAGEVSEAVEYMNQADPENNGEYSNSWYSYGAIAARKLNAQLHEIAQGGIALLTGTGWFLEPDYLGIEEIWEQIGYHPDSKANVMWDFSDYTPHVVVVAVGQNDRHPYDFMKDEYHGQQAEKWRIQYRRWIQNIREKYPRALIVLATTILHHEKEWDDAIEEVTNQLKDNRIVHFLYRENGTGTPGHIRIPEAQQMAEELVAFLDDFGDEIWQED